MTVLQDLRFAIRLLSRHRAFTIAAAGTLAAGVGVNTAFFTIVNAICIRGLPIERPDRVAVVAALDARGRQTGLSYADFGDVRTSTTRLGELAAYRDAPMTIGDEDRAADRVTGTYISAGAFRLLGRSPIVGREFTADDDRTGAPPVALVAHELWVSRYGADPSVVGRQLKVNGVPTTVVGIVPEEFRFPVNSTVWLPLAAIPNVANQPRDARSFSVIARLDDSATIEDVRGELATIAFRLAESNPGTNRDVRLTAVPINDVFNGNITDTVWLAFITAGIIVLLVSCANVANLYLMRSTARSREMAIRTSIGASRTRIVRQLLVECSLVSALGGALGLVLATLATQLLARSVPLGSPLPFWIRFDLDLRVLAVVVGSSAATVFVCGLLPALQASDVRLPRALRIGAHPGAPPGRIRWLTSGFLAAELGLAFVLVTNVTMAMQGAFDWERARVIDATPLLTATITLPRDSYPTAPHRQAFYDELAAQVAALPGVSSFAVASHLPLLGGSPRQIIVEGRDTPGVPPAAVQRILVGERYFEAIGVSVINGRSFRERDGVAGSETVIVNQRLAQELFPDGRVIGQRIRWMDAGATTPSSSATIVGVVPTITRWSTDEGTPAVYEPARGSPAESTTMLVRVQEGEATRVVPALRAVTRRIDPDVPLYRVASLEQAVNDSNWNGRVSARIIITISTIALLLALIGQFVVTAQSVTQRTQEIGLRIAVGARSSRIVRLILGRVLVQLCVGLAFGMFLVLALRSLFPVPSSFDDLQALVAASILIVGVSTVACLVPALRAARIDPVAALRTE